MNRIELRYFESKEIISNEECKQRIKDSTSRAFKGVIHKHLPNGLNDGIICALPTCEEDDSEDDYYYYDQLHCTVSFRPGSPACWLPK